MYPICHVILKRIDPSNLINYLQVRIVELNDPSSLIPNCKAPLYKN